MSGDAPVAAGGTVVVRRDLRAAPGPAARSTPVGRGRALRRTTRSVAVAEVILRVETVNPTGSPTLLLIHGWGSDRQVWRQLVTLADPTCRFVLVDLRGHGGSSTARTSHTIDGMADDLEQLLSLMRVDRAVVVGHSMGANVAVELGVRRPDRVEGVVAIDPAYDDPGWADATPRLAELRDRGAQAAAAVLPAAFGPVVSPEAVATCQQTLLTTPQAVLIEALASTYLDERAFGHRVRTRSKLAELQVPLLSLYARPSVADHAASFPVEDHTVTTISGSGHFIPVEQPRAVWAAIAAWLSRPRC